ncbi:MAG: L-seryl-tRNA(Sec) selenium transferase [Vicinamibacteria bacterium]|nr:L-seryl-tRNA(Sec) selenium transferase [Vicinamibacteria bacterium]
MTPPEDPRRRIPQIARLLDRDAVKAAIAARGRAVVERAIQARIAELRRLAEGNDSAAFERALQTLDARIVEASEEAAAHSLRRVINATGVVVHTNLGRAPLSPEIAAHVAAVASSYSNLEYDLEKGDRGHRETHAEGRLQAMLKAEASVVVNNNAAAVLLAVNTFAEGREVLVSRGELVEIGGSFRIPEILRKGGARLVEVGTTNRTRVADFANAITPQTGLILRVHPSNFRVVGFTESAGLKELVDLGRQRSVTVVEDLGSGLLAPMARPLDGEATIAESLAAGVDVVTASGDKLLGGPQAGLLVGRKKAVDALRRNPLYRALRVDKMTIAALDSVLSLHEAGRREELPVPRMLALPKAAIRARVERLRDRLLAAGGAGIDIRDVDSAVGGGAAPDIVLPSCALAVTPSRESAESLARRLREASPPIIARIEDDVVLFDLRTVLHGEDEEIERILLGVWKGAIPTS